MTDAMVRWDAADAAEALRGITLPAQWHVDGWAAEHRSGGPDLVFIELVHDLGHRVELDICAPFVVPDGYLVGLLSAVIGMGSITSIRARPPW